MDAYCNRESKERNTVRFLFEGVRVNDTDTPASLEMEDGDNIEVFLEQQGGDGTPKPEEEQSTHINVKVWKASPFHCSRYQRTFKTNLPLFLRH